MPWVSSGVVVDVSTSHAVDAEAECVNCGSCIVAEIVADEAGTESLNAKTADVEISTKSIEEQPSSKKAKDGSEAIQRSAAFALSAFNSVIEYREEEVPFNEQSPRRRSRTLGKCIIRKIREDLVAQKHTPKQERLCGRCKPLEINQTANYWPDKRTHRDLRSSFNKIRNMKKGAAKSERLDQLQTEVDNIQMPPLPAQSALSRKPHHKLKVMPAFDVFNLEVQIMQHKVKEPLMKQEIAGADSSTFKRMTEDLDLSTLRIIVRKKPHQRTFRDSLRVFEFLRKQLFFKDLSNDLLAHLANHLQACRYEVGESLYQKGDQLSGVYILIRGRAVIKDLEPVKQEEEEPGHTTKKFIRKRSVLNDSFISAELSAKDVADIEELQSSNKVFGVSDLLQEVLWPTVPLHLAAAVIEEPADVLHLPADRLLPMLEEENLKERLSALQELFPTTKGKSEEDLMQLSRIERSGVRVPIHRLFDVREVPRSHKLFFYGEHLPAKDANVFMILSGTVELSGLQKKQEAMTRGTVLGEEALHCQPYAHTAVVTSGKARVLSIRVNDFVTQFMNGRYKASTFQEPSNRVAAMRWKAGLAKLADSMKLQGTSEDHVDDEDGELGSIALFKRHAQPKKGKRENQLWNLFCSEWKDKLKKEEQVTANWNSSVVPKMVPKRVAPGAEAQTNRRNRLQALETALDDGSPRRGNHGKIFPEAPHVATVKSDVSPRRLAHKAEEEVLTPSGRRYKQTHISALEAFCSDLDDLDSRGNPDDGATAAPIDSSIRDTMPNGQIKPPKSVTFKPQPPIRRMFGTTSPKAVEVSGHGRAPAVSAAVTATLAESLDRLQETTIRRPSAFANSQSPRRPLASGLNRTAAELARLGRNEARPSALAMTAQAMLASTLPGGRSRLL